MLDLAETCEQSLKRVCLSAICTILENPKSFQYFVEWSSGRTTINASQLLIKLYNEEDKRFGVQIDNGILQNVERPLNPGSSFYLRKQQAIEGDAPVIGNTQAEVVAPGSSSSQLKMIDGGVDATAKLG